MKILINGNFLNRNLTGIERFAWETCRRLDALLTNKDDFYILIASNAKLFPEFKNIKIIISPESISRFPKWDMGVFKKACKKLKATGLNFSNTAPRGKYCGFSFIHDIYAADCPEDFTSFKDKLVKLYSSFCYKNIARNARQVFTVSQFSKERIVKRYRINADRVSVIPNGWEHFNCVEEDQDIFKRFPELLQKDFYFTLGSLSRRKNLAWIARYAAKHPDEHFAVSGKAISGLVPQELEVLKELKNVTLAGYVSDGEVKALMKKCRAFIFPSYYEGFGIPPLEALSTGCQAVVSKAACLPEIYGDSVHYIDPDNSGVNLKEILREPVGDSEAVLKKYTYDNAARLLLDKIRSFY
ncbi:glycosyltransferase family 1 protein [Treponema sp.]|uniref:glycosyltransferase family 4 protein n=1 Tax=Treponema sp. TaxID=166 RepID=UPI0025E8A5D7|nr:glycosyltransferase family 1 protein [Treponema sp.]MCR5218654.1 glycosyltransferase family 4 protein [Treponema sp.]